MQSILRSYIRDNTRPRGFEETARFRGVTFCRSCGMNEWYNITGTVRNHYAGCKVKKAIDLLDALEESF